MNTYLLLRDNKQTGPYTAEELAAKGLKPYDLVWHEGRSAAWRYPSEIEELKAFAPVVEEQPYDRFYKKAGEQAAQSSAQSNTAQQAAVATAVQEKPVSKQAEQISTKHIYVTLPGGKTPVTNTTTPAAKKEEAAKPVVQQNDNNAYSTTIKSTGKKAAAASYIVSEDDDELNSSMLKGYRARKKEDDEINDGYLSDYESRKAAYSNQKSGNVTATTKQKQTEKPALAAVATKESWSTPKKERVDLKTLLAGSGKYLQNNKNVTRGLVAAVLILGGVVIGLVINSGRRAPDTKALETLVKEIREQQNEKGSASGPATETTQKNKEPQEAERNSNNNANNSIEPSPSVPVHSNPPNQPVMRHAVIKKENSVVTPPPTESKSIAVSVSNTNTQAVETTPAVIEPREKTINQEVLEKARRNIYEQVHIEASAFKTGLFGGISDLDITVQNKSLFPLDQVAVEIKYFGPEKKLVKTQTLIFNNVPPGKRRTLDAPPTNRGIAIDYTITSINSKALGLAQTGF